MTAEGIAARMGRSRAITFHLTVEDCVDSTNDRLKQWATMGAPQGTVLLAREQRAGRGTHGRSFVSPRGEGLYLSLLLRPTVSAAQLFSLTGWVAVAVRRAVVGCCGAEVHIKWMNDLYLHGRKLCGILTELSPIGPGGQVDWVVVGIGLNLSQSRETFQRLGLGHIATSLAAEGYQVEGAVLAARVLEELDGLWADFPREEARWLEEYRGGCLQIGRPVYFETGSGWMTGVARRVADDFSLEVEGVDGHLHRICAGTVRLTPPEQEDGRDTYGQH